MVSTSVEDSGDIIPFMTAYPAARTSPPLDCFTTDWRDGWIKLSLGHSAQGSVLVPSLLFAKAGPWRFFQPSFFDPCQLTFNIEAQIHAASLSMYVASPRGSKAARLHVEVRSDQHVRAYEEGAQLYRCRFAGPSHIAPYAAGRCRKLKNDDFALDLFHHTKRASLPRNNCGLLPGTCRAIGVCRTLRIHTSPVWLRFRPRRI